MSMIIITSAVVVVLDDGADGLEDVIVERLSSRV